MLEANERIFIYVRLSANGVEVARSKLRELAGLGSALADLTGELLSNPRPVEPGALRFEYVDAETERPLITIRSEDEAQIIEGQIPDRHRGRMIDDPPGIDVDRFEARAGRTLDPPQREALRARLDAPQPDLLGLIRAHIDPDGAFYIRIPRG